MIYKITTEQASTTIEEWEVEGTSLRNALDNFMVGKRVLYSVRSVKAECIPHKVEALPCSTK